MPETIRIFILSSSFGLLLCGCGGANATDRSVPPPGAQVSAPTISLKPAQKGAQIVTLTTKTKGATIHYTVDGSTPAATSPIFEAPFLVANDQTLRAVAILAGDTDSAVTSQVFAPNIAPGTLVWNEEFTNTTGANQQPDPSIWMYDTGASGFGNHELETYCAWGSTTSPCDPSSPNAYVGTDNMLHIVARKTTTGYTSARMKSQGLFSLQYGRLEAKIRIPEAQGLWPAFWTLGNNIATADWPACGEQDIAERVNAALSPDWNEGSVHGPGFTGDVGLGTKYAFPQGQTAAGWHTYGMIWKKNSVAYYIDDASNPYATFTNPASLTGLPGAVWPFDTGDSAFLLINLAVGGDWPGAPNASTPFPSTLLVDYVRLYTN